MFSGMLLFTYTFIIAAEISGQPGHEAQSRSGLLKAGVTPGFFASRSRSWPGRPLAEIIKVSVSITFRSSENFTTKKLRKKLRHKYDAEYDASG